MSKSHLIDINTATEEELVQQLRGIGPSKAHSIIKAREARGGFESLHDLEKIPGISQSLLDINSAHLTITSSKRLTRNSAKSKTWPRQARRSREELSLSPPRTRSHSTASDELGVVAGLRSRKYSTALQNGMKQKRKVTKDGQSLSPEKKLCRSEFLTSPASDSALDDFKHQRASSMLRSRIPSKTNPPPELANWLAVFQEWSHAERLMALDQLVENCEPTQVRHLMTVIEPLFQRDFISLLPKEVALQVLEYLSPYDLCRAAQTCRYWRVLAEDNLMWRKKCEQANISEDMVYESHFGSRPKRRLPYKRVYRRQMKIENNWIKQDISNPAILRGHDDHVITCVEFCEDKIVSGSDDNTLKVWSATTYECLMTLQGHTGGVWSSQMRGDLLISGSTDRSLKIWDLVTGMCQHTLLGHTSTVRCLSLHEDIVVSGSRDASLRLWNVNTGACLHVLQGHVAAVRCVQYDGRRVVSGAYDYMVKVWEPETETCLFTLQGHTNRVYSLQFDGSRIVSGSLDTYIRVWDVETGQCLHTLVGHQSLTSGMELKDNILVSGNADSTVKVWDITTGSCLQTLTGKHKHQSAVTCLQFNRKLVITSSDDGTVKLWNVETGEFVRDLVKLPSGGSGGVVWRIKATNTKLICAVGSRNGTEETKLIILDFDCEDEEPVEEEEEEGLEESKEEALALEAFSEVEQVLGGSNEGEEAGLEESSQQGSS